MQRVLDGRTRWLTVALENIYQSQNASAVLRTCDAFGIQDVHIIEDRNRYRLNPAVELGSARWLTLRRYQGGSENIEGAIRVLRADGYRIVATTPYANMQGGVRDMAQLDLTKGRVALLFGNELEGLSSQTIEHADERISISMVGFVESLNISVSVAVIVDHLMRCLRDLELPWRLSSDERLEIELAWLRADIGYSPQLEAEFRRRMAISPDESQRHLT